MITQIDSLDFWSQSLLGNTLTAYANASLVFLVFVFVFFLVNYIVMRQCSKIADATDTEFDNIFLEILASVKPPFYIFIAFFIGLSTLTLDHLVQRSLFVIVVVWSAWQVMQIFDALVDYSTGRTLKSRKINENMQSAIKLLSTLAKVGLWIVAILMVLSNFGVNTTSLIAGFGIGGIAIAFAVKGILEDLFSSFSIYFDKPFQVNDMIEVDGEKGIVKKIGIKTTRLKSMATGEEIIMNNKELTSMKINNYHHMAKRRTSFDLGVTYETPTAKLKKIPGIIEKIIVAEENVEFNRAHFRSFDDSALRFSVLYHMNTRDYDLFLATHERILFQIREVFEKEKIDMAYPTQTIYMAKG